MRDPHVVSLRYLLVTDDTVSFSNPPVVEWLTDAFRLRLENGVAEVGMVEHYASEREARERVDSYLRAYEVHAALSQHGRQELRFEFDKSGTQVIDRNPPPPGSPQAISVQAVGVVFSVGSPSFHVTRRQYPSPPNQFVLSPDAETLWHRYVGYLNGREPLASMGYACLTWLEAAEGARARVAAKYSIGIDVLQMLGRLTSTAGDAQTARKFEACRIPTPYTGTEAAWVEAAVRALILRVGQWAADPNAPLPQLTLAELPPLTD
jgi:hypothetical protein